MPEEGINSSHLFYSLTYGELRMNEVLEKILDYIQEKPDYPYRIVIGTDSQPKDSKRMDFVNAIVVHRIGAGGIYFWRRFIIEEKKYVLRERIYEEAYQSLNLAQEFIKRFPKGEILGYDLEIHVDIGRVGETREMISEVVGMIRGSGFEVKTKPEAYGASTVADRHA